MTKAENNKVSDVKEVNDFVVEFRKYKTELTKKFLNRKPWVPRDISKIESFIPGTITTIYVKEGQHIEAGQELMILEAMKMKNIIFSEFPGTINKINVKTGDQIPKAKVIFELDLD
jgi:biotin carboxyl carrier protein